MTDGYMSKIQVSLNWVTAVLFSTMKLLQKSFLSDHKRLNRLNYVSKQLHLFKFGLQIAQLNQTLLTV